MEKALLLGSRFFGTCLFDISAAFLSVGWHWICSLLDELRLPPWVVRAVRGLMEGSVARGFLNGRVCEGASFPIRRGIRHGCPTSGSVWALLFDPVVRCLSMALPSPHDSLTCFADDLAAALVQLGAGLRALLPVFLEVFLARLSLNSGKCAVVNFSGQPNHSIKRVLHDVPGASQFLVVGSATYLGVLIGPLANDTFWGSAVGKYAARVDAIRHAARHLRVRLTAYRHAAAALARSRFRGISGDRRCALGRSEVVRFAGLISSTVS